jgi:hypothetical protein
MPPSTKAPTRRPPQPNSIAQVVPERAGNRERFTGNIGSTDAGSGCHVGSAGGSIRCTIQSRSLVWNSTYRPVTRVPCSTILTSRSVHFSVS